MASASTMSNFSSFTTCNTQSLSLPNNFSGIKVTSIAAVPVTNYSMIHGSPAIVWTKSQISELDFCNVSVDYEHPGRNDAVTVTVLLPEAGAWNGRFAGIGGGGWAASQGALTMTPAVDAGFAAASTDGGVPLDGSSSASWALLSPGNPDIARLDVWANQALHEMTLIGKAVTEAYYSNAPSYSYWVGCSQGGRQGNTIAQRYPDDYDGIAALAPGINWAKFFPGLQWPRQLMNELNYFPPTCETSAFTAAAVDHCDAADGVIDGVISRPDLCTFDPFSIVGSSFDCDGEARTFTSEGAKIVHGAWSGMQTRTGISEWYGFAQDARLVDQVANPVCAKPSNCTISTPPVDGGWLQDWAAADPSLDLGALTRDAFIDLVHTGVIRYESIISANYPDLRPFRDAGGKMIIWHGWADQLIPTLGSVDYHNRVREVDANIDDYFRLFLVPGTAHCTPGSGPFPTHVLEDLMAWVEGGHVPEQLVAQNISAIDPATGELRDTEAQGHGRPVCMMPKVLEYIGGDPEMLSSFQCVESSEHKPGRL